MEYNGKGNSDNLNNKNKRWVLKSTHLFYICERTKHEFTETIDLP